MSTNSNNDFVKQRIEALGKFEDTEAEYVLFLNSSVILNKNTTLKAMVIQHQHVIAPMIKVNAFKPSYLHIIPQIGLYDNINIPTSFPHSSSRITWLHDRYYVSSKKFSKRDTSSGLIFKFYRKQSFFKVKYYWTPA